MIRDTVPTRYSTVLRWLGRYRWVVGWALDMRGSFSIYLVLDIHLPTTGGSTVPKDLRT